jgi:hypothetical protein
MRRSGVLLTAALACAALAAGLAWGRSAATADLSVKWIGPTPAKPVAGANFSLGASIVNAGPDRGHFRVNVQVPAGVRRIGGTLECTGSGPTFTCDEGTATVGDNGTGTMSFIADAPGTYAFVVYLDRLDAADPVSANNTDTISVTVAEAAHVFAAGPISIAPRRPLPGSTVVVSFGVRDTTAGAAATITAARCRVTPGRSRARVVGGRATCTIRTPARHGALLKGVLSADAGGGTFSRAFSVRLR